MSPETYGFDGTSPANALEEIRAMVPEIRRDLCAALDRGTYAFEHDDELAFEAFQHAAINAMSVLRCIEDAALPSYSECFSNWKAARRSERNAARGEDLGTDRTSAESLASSPLPASKAEDPAPRSSVRTNSSKNGARRVRAA